MKAHLGWFLIVASVAGLLSVPLAYATGYRWVKTPSVPMGLYRTRVASEVARDAYVCLLPVHQAAPEVLRASVRNGLLPREWKHQSLMKQVVAVAGDVITYVEGRGIAVNGNLVADSVRLEKDRYGTPLPRPALPTTLRCGEVWLGSAHARGFDSRYFGPVRIEALQCVGEPAWTF